MGNKSHKPTKEEEQALIAALEQEKETLLAQIAHYKAQAEHYAEEQERRGYKIDIDDEKLLKTHRRR